MFRPLPQRKIVSPIQRLQLKPKQQPVIDTVNTLIGYKQIVKLLGELETLKTEFNNKIEEVGKAHQEYAVLFENKLQEAEKAISEIQKGDVGEQGIQGIRGDKGEKGDRGEQGLRGEKGEVGSTPIAGFDFPLPKDGIDGKHATPEIVVEHIIKNKVLKVEHIQGLQQTIESYRKQVADSGWKMRGGGDTVKAGTGILLTRNPDGTTTVTAIASGTNIDNELVSGSGTTFTLANTPVAGSVKLYAARNRIYPTTDFSIAGAVITTVLSWSAGDLIADYRM